MILVMNGIIYLMSIRLQISACRTEKSQHYWNSDSGRNIALGGGNIKQKCEDKEDV